MDEEGTEGVLKVISCLQLMIVSDVCVIPSRFYFLYSPFNIHGTVGRPVGLQNC